MTTNDNPKLIPLTHWNRYHSWPSERGLRHYVFWEKYNGFDKVALRVGRRILIDETAFFEWVRQNNRDGGCYDEA